jgi:hypothetical protein
MNKTAFVVSVVLTTFVLMIFAGVVYALRAPQVSTEVESVPENSIEAEPTLDPSLEQALLEREKIYQQRIAEANTRLEQAQKQLAAQSMLGNQQPNSQTAMAEVTSEQAVQAAVEFLGQDNVYWVEIVSVSGEDMYMVTFTTGDMVYVNMAGQVVGSSPAQLSGSSIGGAGKKTISTKGDDQNQEEHEHESEDDDHD